MGVQLTGTGTVNLCSQLKPMDLVSVYRAIPINFLKFLAPLGMVRGPVGTAFFVMLTRSVAPGSIPGSNNDFILSYHCLESVGFSFSVKNLD